MSAVAGRVDGVDAHGRVRGWAWLPSAPATRVMVSVVEGAEPLAAGLAALPRPDLRGAGHGDGNCGFLLALPERLFDGRLHRLSVRAEVPGAAPFVADLSLDLPLSGLNPSDARADWRAPVYVPGQYVRCARLDRLPPWHTAGWHAPEAAFTWIKGLEGRLELSVPPPQQAYTLELDAVPNAAAGCLQTLEVFANYLRLGCFAVPSAMTLAVKLPAEVFFLSWTHIALFCRHAGSGGADPRRLGIALRGWSIG